jgi:hypothetical protein
MCWDADIVHRPDTELVDADYWSYLGTNLDFNPLFVSTLILLFNFRSHTQSPQIFLYDLRICYYHGPCLQKPTADTNTANTLHMQGLLIDISMSTSWDHTIYQTFQFNLG